MSVVLRYRFYQNRVAGIFAFAGSEFRIDDIAFVETGATVYARLKIAVAPVQTLIFSCSRQEDGKIIQAFFC